MGIGNYLVDTVEVAVENYESTKSAPDPASLNPVSCLSVAGKRTAQNFHPSSSFLEPGGSLRQQNPFFDGDHDPMPLQAQTVRERLREIDGRNVVGRRRGEGLSSPRESRADSDGRLLDELKLTATHMSHERYLTASLDRKYGKNAGKGSLVHPHAHEYGIMVDSVGRLVPKGTSGKVGGSAGGKAGKGLQAEVITLAKMHAEGIEKERKDAEKVDDVEMAIIRRNAIKEAAVSKKVKGSSCFSTVARDKALLGNRMAPPVSQFGPGHYNISYDAQEKHSGVKDMRASWMPGGRHLLDISEFLQEPPESPNRSPRRRVAGPHDSGEEGQEAPVEDPEAAETRRENGDDGGERDFNSGHPPDRRSRRAPRGSEDNAKEQGGSEPRQAPMSSSFMNTGFDAPLVSMHKMPDGGAHLGPTKYSANYNSVRPATKLIADFKRQTDRPPMTQATSEPGPGFYELPRGSIEMARRKKFPQTRAFDKQKGREGTGGLLDPEGDDRPFSAPVVVHPQSAPMPFSRAAMDTPFAPAEAMAALAKGRTTSPHAAIAAGWDRSAKSSASTRGKQNGSFSYADIGMGMWFDEWGRPLEDDSTGGRGSYEYGGAAEYAVSGGKATRYGGVVRPGDGAAERWATGGLRVPPKLGTMPKTTRTDEVMSMRLSGSNKSGGTSTGLRASRPDFREGLSPQYDYVKERSPSWSLPRNRHDKPKKWKPPKKLIQEHM